MKHIMDLLTLSRVMATGVPYTEGLELLKLDRDILSRMTHVRFNNSPKNVVRMLNDGVVPEIDQPEFVGFFYVKDSNDVGALIVHEGRHIVFTKEIGCVTLSAGDGKVDRERPAPFNNDLFEAAGLALGNAIYFTLKAYCDSINIGQNSHQHQAGSTWKI